MRSGSSAIISKKRRSATTSAAAFVSLSRAATSGAPSTSLSACLYAELAWQSTHCGTEWRSALCSAWSRFFDASALAHSHHCSLTKPGPASSTAFTFAKSTCSSTARSTWP